MPRSTPSWPAASWPVPRARSWPSTATPPSAATTTWGCATRTAYRRSPAGPPRCWPRPAASGSRALVTLVSGLGPLGGPDRSLTLTLTGRLDLGPRESCTCCGEERHDVPLHLDFVVVSHAGGEQRRVPLAAFRSPALKLNRGYLQRALEHANDCHREDLGQVVVRTTGTPAEQLLDARLSDLTDARRRAHLDRPRGRPPGVAVVLPPRRQRRGAGRAAAPGAARGHLLSTKGCRSPRSPTTSGSARYEWFDVNVTLVRGSSGLLVVDTHASAVAAREVIEDVRALVWAPARSSRS